MGASCPIEAWFGMLSRRLARSRPFRPRAAAPAPARSYRADHAWLAVAVLVPSVAGCALAHERSAGASRVDAGLVVADASAHPDAVSIDAAQPPDTGPITSCVDFWVALPWCPTAPRFGEPCYQPGITCGTHCCDPIPPMQCVGGFWEALDIEVVCPPGLDCQPSLPCGDGTCAPDRVCMRTLGEDLGPDAHCVLPPSPIAVCDAAPPGALGTDPGSCTTCSCLDRSGVGGVVVALDCTCCDVDTP